MSDWRITELRGRTVTSVNMDSIGSHTSRSGHTSYMHPSGTGTTPATRAAVQIAPAPHSIGFAYSTSGRAHDDVGSAPGRIGTDHRNPVERAKNALRPVATAP